MQHVDEGALHAYLDGALDAVPSSEAERIRQHLASCEMCASRLEEERALRAEAEAILAGADPGEVGAPPLEELRRRALARTRADSGVRLRRLSWAASLVVAAGAGWMLRGAQAPRFSEALNPELREVQRDAGARDEARNVAGAPAVIEAPAAAAVPVEEVESEAKFVEPPASAFVREAAEDSLRRTLVARRAQVASIVADSARPPMSPSVAVASGLRADEARDEVSRARAAARTAAPVLALIPTEENLASLSVPGLPVLAVLRGEKDLPAGALRVLQLLDGDTLEILHLPAGTDPGTLAWRDDGHTQVVVRYGAGWLVGRARTSREALEAQLSRLTGGA